MFDAIRNHKKYLMGFLMILIIPSFVLFGVQGFTSMAQQGETVATVNGQDISQVEWDQAHQAQSQQLQQSMPSLDPKVLDSAEARYGSLERLVRERTLAAAATKFHLQASDQRLARELQENEAIAALRGPDGKLDVEGYRTLVARQGFTPESFEARMRADLSQRQVVDGVQSSAFATPALASVSLNAFFERREIRVARFSPTEFAPQVNPTDVEIEAFYKGNSALFQAPEQADVEYLVLNVDAVAKGVKLPEADVRAYYDQNAASLSGTEERRARHILLSIGSSMSGADKEKLKQRATELLAQVRQDPSKFAELAQAQSQDPGSAVKGGDLDFFARGAMVKPFEDAVFALKKDDIADLVESEFGFHIIQLTDIKAPAVKVFEELKPSIEADLKKQQAQKVFAEKAESFTNSVYENFADLKPTADALGLVVQSAKGLTRKANPEAGVLGDQRFLDAIFSPDSLEKKRNIAATEMGAAGMASGRVLAYTPARTKALDEVRAEVRARLVAQRSAELARAAGEKKLAEWKGGTEASALAPAITISRDNAGDLSAPMVTAALAANTKTLPAWTGVALPDQGYAVIRIDKVLGREATDAARQTQELTQYSQWWAAAEAQAYYETLKDSLNVSIKAPAPKVKAEP